MGEGMYVYIWLIHFIVQQKPTHCKAITFQFKKVSPFIFFTTIKKHGNQSYFAGYVETGGEPDLALELFVYPQNLGGRNLF